jgi:F-type H+-transporting ATPase subunit c
MGTTITDTVMASMATAQNTDTKSEYHRKPHFPEGVSMNLVRKLGVVFGALVTLLAVADTVFAQDKGVVNQPFGTPGWGAGIGAGLVIIGAAIGFGRIGGSALESMARQPETAGRVQTAMIIIGALLEGATFFALIVCLQVAGRP